MRLPLIAAATNSTRAGVYIWSPLYPCAVIVAIAGDARPRFVLSALPPSARISCDLFYLNKIVARLAWFLHATGRGDADDEEDHCTPDRPNHIRWSAAGGRRTPDCRSVLW